jgi:hypothetical protein
MERRSLTQHSRLNARLQANFTCIQPLLEPHVSSVHHAHPPVSDQFLSMVANTEDVHTLEDGTKNYTYPLPYSASSDDKDMLNYGEMLAAHDRPQFVTAMQQEIDGLCDILQPYPRSHLPDNEKALPTVWAFKRKHLPDWSIVKWKARLNIHGGRQQHGVNFWETYAPVVN